MQVTINGMTGNEIVSKAGKVIGARMVFSGELTASQVRKDLKASGLKGSALTAKVNEVLTGGSSMAWAKHDAAVSLLRSSGYVPDYVDAKKASAVVRLVKPTKAAVPTKEELEVQLAATMGVDVEVLRAMTTMPAAK